MPDAITNTLFQLARNANPVTARTIRVLRRALRALDSEHSPALAEAETVLYAHQSRAIPLLRETVRTPSIHNPNVKIQNRDVRRSVRAAVLLSRFQQPDGCEHLHRFALEPHLRNGESHELLRQALTDYVGVERYLQSARVALARLEQYPESIPAIIRFRHALEILRFLHAALPADLLSRALVVRQVGGENISLVRQVLAPDPDPLIEHVCMARQQAVLTLLHFQPREAAFPLLARNFAHPSAAVKLTALYGLSVLGDVRAVPLVTVLACDAGSELQEDARFALSQLRRESGDAVTLLRHSRPIADDADLLRPTRFGVPRDADEFLRPVSFGSRETR